MVGQHVSLSGGLFGADEAQNVVSHARIAAPVAADVDDEVRGPPPPDLVEGLVEYLVRLLFSGEVHFLVVLAESR